MGHTNSGPHIERVSALADYVLTVHEKERDLHQTTKSKPERIKGIKTRCIKELCDDKNPVSEKRREELFRQLDDTFLVGQLFSYRGNYVAESPTI